MNILFITPSEFTGARNGGEICSKRNYDSLVRHGDVIVYKIQKKSNVRSLFSAMTGFYPPDSYFDIKKLSELIEQNRIDFIFFDQSGKGKLLKILKGKYKLTSIVFFHNCESDYNKVRFGEEHRIKQKIYQYLIEKNERDSVYFGDCLVALSERDSNRIFSLYGKKVDFIIPLSIQDTFDPTRKTTYRMKDGYCLLFGAFGTANRYGYEWFVKNVSPKLKIKTVIAGRGFERFKKVWSNERVEVFGFVEDLQDLYARAACVAIPLFSGGGMKIKTAEALMYGKYILGTEEAFSGFGHEVEKVGKRCNTASEFIAEINKISESDDISFNELARQIYMEKYSTESSQKYFDELVKTVNEGKRNADR